MKANVNAVEEASTLMRDIFDAVPKLRSTGKPVAVVFALRLAPVVFASSVAVSDVLAPVAL
uniref:Unannotated protein n=1 Tax=freshwater metagenome TaxID=449393 RepID=A0A6J5ZEY7_9ZZZZ